MENVYYPPTIKEAAPSSSKVRDAPVEAKAIPKEPARESEPSRAAETSEGLNPDVT